MSPIYVKGGVWSNVEDEILKAAISKYGLNQWSRASSLLSKKTAKQCKLRWQEWLNPTIKKLEWTKEEDNKLLNLIKLRPNQWNSISLLMNRTSNQCIERYQQLLDDNLSNSDLKLTGNVVNASGRSMNGVDELNLNPESKPARPDFEDLNEDEQEMLSEARARLANTQGKKAKRKARERMLNESKRIALLQKRRELKQVGINTNLKAKKKFATQMDYNKDIALERQPGEGRFDVSEELESNSRDKFKFNKSTDTKGSKNQEHDKELKKDKRRRDEEKKGKNKLSYEEKGEVFNNQDDYNEDEFEFKRKRLQLSKPGDTNENDNQVDIDTKINEKTRDLYQQTYTRSVLFTKSKDEDESEEEQEKEPEVSHTEQTKPKTIQKSQNSLLSKLNSLPTPLNDFELIPDEEDDLYGVNSNRNDSKSETRLLIDKGEELTQLRKQQEIELVRVQKLRTSLSAQKGLPLPSYKALDSYHKKLADANQDTSNKLIDEEMIKLMKEDFEQRFFRDESSKTDESIDIRLLENVKKLTELESTKLDLSTYESEVFSNFKYNSMSDEIPPNKLIEALKLISVKSNKLEKKLNLKIAGYMKNESIIAADISKKILMLNELKNNLSIYETIEADETLIINNRKDQLQDVEVLNVALSDAQNRLLSM